MSYTLPQATELNLDTMSHSELVQFATAIGHGARPLRQARALFPDRTEGIVQATKLLRGYAWNKVTAVSLRELGKINTAKVYEDICDSLYKRLPDWARGW